MVEILTQETKVTTYTFKDKNGKVFSNFYDAILSDLGIPHAPNEIVPAEFYFRNNPTVKQEYINDIQWYVFELGPDRTYCTFIVSTVEQIEKAIVLITTSLGLEGSCWNLEDDREAYNHNLLCKFYNYYVETLEEKKRPCGFYASIESEFDPYLLGYGDTNVLIENILRPVYTFVNGVMATLNQRLIAAKAIDN